MAAPTILDVVSAAIDGREPPVDDDTTTGDDNEAGSTDGAAAATDDAGAGTEGAAGADGAAEDGDDSAEGSEAGDDGDGEAGAVELGPDGRARDATGKFVAKKGDKKDDKAADPAAAAKKPNDKAADPAAAAKKPDDKAAGAKKPDPINDPIPQELKTATKERIQTLVQTAKTLTTERDAVKGDLDLLLAPITAAGATVEQFQEQMNLLGMINSGDPTQITKAHERFQAIADALATHLGLTPAGMDPLEGHADLIDRVNKRVLTRKDAEEIAASRRAAAAAASRTSRTEAIRTQTEQQQAQIASGRAAVVAIETQLKRLDPDYAAKDAIMRADKGFLQKLRTTPPGEWSKLYLDQYSAIQLPATSAAGSATTTAAAPGAARRLADGPLRTKTPAGGGATVTTPKSALEALNGALAGM